MKSVVEREQIMNREEILSKSRAENKNKDIYELEIQKQANTYAVIVLLILATIFTAVQIVTGGGINYGLYALAFCGNMTLAWVKYMKQRQNKELAHAIILTLFVAAASACHIYNLITVSPIL